MVQGQQRQVLIVDDDPDIRETFAEALEYAGYAVVNAANGAEALEVLRDLSPCAILLDLMMPVMDGFEFRLRQRLDPRLAQIPVVVISAGRRADPKVIDAAAYLDKPLKLAALLEALERCCRADACERAGA